jgi:hypothetical protein
MFMFCRSLFVLLSFFSFGHCVVFPSSIYGFWYLQTIFVLGMWEEIDGLSKSIIHVSIVISNECIPNHPIIDLNTVYVNNVQQTLI